MKKYYTKKLYWLLLLVAWLPPGKTLAKNDTLPTDTTRAWQHKKQRIACYQKQAGTYQIGNTRTFSGLGSLPAMVTQAPNVQALYQQRIKVPVPDSIRQRIDEIEATFKKVTQENRFAKLITGDELFRLKLPMGMDKTIAGKSYTLLFHGIDLRKDFATVKVSMKLPVPETQNEASGERSLYFWGEVKLSQDGGFKGGKIGLLVNFPLKFGEHILTFRKSTLGKEQPDGTYASFDCGGFKTLGIRGMLEFSRNTLVPELANGKPDTTANHRVKGLFHATTGGWHDILLEIDLPQRFQVTSLPRFGFKANKAVLDLSDDRNAAGQQFPEGYAANYLPEGNPNLWRGLSIRHFEMWLPGEFKKITRTRKPVADTTKAAVDTSRVIVDTVEIHTNRINIRARNILIDKRGLTGEIKIKNVIRQNEGKLGKWAFSVEHLYIKLVATQLQAGTFRGKVILPVGKTNPADTSRTSPGMVGYSVIINPVSGDYVAKVEYNKRMTMDLWAAQMEVLPSSTLEIGVKNNALIAKAVLNGKFTNIGNDKLNNALQMKDIAFERLTIMTTPPYFVVGAMSLGGVGRTQKLGGFSFTVDQIGFAQGEAERIGQNGLQVSGKVNFTKGSNGFGASASGTVWGRLINTPHGFQVPVFEEVELNKIGIDVDMGAFRLAGHLDFYNADPLYGKGFRGEIDAAFGKAAMRVDIKAIAMFGNVKGFNYWFADALGTFKPALPLVSQGVRLGGFGGGAYYHMRRTTEPNWGNQLGQTRSGIGYEPDQATALGIKASVLLTGPSSGTYNGEAGFEIAFNRNGGIRRVGFEASLSIAAPGITVSIPVMQKITDKITRLETSVDDASGNLLSKLGVANKNGASQSYSESGNGAIKALASIDYDLENNSLHANLSVDINVAKGAITGGGEAVFHFAPDTWYVHIGTPARRIGLNIMGVVETGSYFMLGDHIPEPPPPPPHIGRILGLQSACNNRDNAALLAGKGLAFGSDFSMDTGNMSFLMFYARFAAGLGYDVTLKKYADGISCKGRPGNIGINNWYAQGQMYGFFEGEIGIQVNLPFKKGNFPIIQGEMAALMQAQLPNPVWIRGIVGGKFSILGGLVQGDCRFELEIGQRCELTGGNALNGVEIISDVSPAAGTPEVGVFASPQATFNLPVNKSFEVRDLAENKLKKYRAKLDHFRVTEGTSGKTIGGNMEWNHDHTTLAFVPDNILPSEKVLHVDVQVSFEENKQGSWQTVAGIREKKSLDFKTSKAPDHIVRQNIAYSYPVIQQLHFLPGETSQGYIQLKQGRPDLFRNDEISRNFEQKVRFVAAGNPHEIKEVPLAYDETANRLTFDIPQGLGKQVVYHWQIVNVPKSQQSKADANVTGTTSTSNPANVLVTTKKLEGTRAVFKEKKVFEAAIRTSLYTTMAAKFDALRRAPGWSWPVMTGVHVLGTTFTGKETFDLFETAGANGNPALVELEATIEHTPWYRQAIYPLVYRHLATLPLSRAPQPYGVPPFRAMFINQENRSSMLSEETLLPDKPVVYQGSFIFDLPSVMQRDYTEMVYQAAALKLSAASQPNNFTHKLLSTPFPGIYSGSYEVIIRYRLPGSRKITFERKFLMTNP